MFYHSGVTCEKRSCGDKAVSLNITHHLPLQGNKQQLAGQCLAQNLAYCHLKFGKQVSAIKQPVWYVYNSIPGQNMAVIYLNQMFFIVLYSIGPVNKNLYYSCNIRADFFKKICLQ